MRVKCLALEHNTMSSARARTQTARSGVERINHEATPCTFEVLTKIRVKYDGEKIIMDLCIIIASCLNLMFETTICFCFIS